MDESVAMPVAPSFRGRRVLAFESRRAREIEVLIATFGGQPIVAPALCELPNPSDEAALEFADALIAGRFDAVIFLTGAGARALVDAVDRADRRFEFLQALRRTRVITRGPKPVAVMRELRIPVWVNAPEPNTWQELVTAVDAQAGTWPLTGKCVAVQEYGVSNVALLEALEARGAEVTAVPAYRWGMPDDIAPLERAAKALARGDVDVVLVTSGIQFVHFWRVASDLGLEDAVRRALAHTLLASIGPSASAELRRHGVEPTFEPTHPKMGLLVREAAAHSSPPGD